MEPANEIQSRPVSVGVGRTGNTKSSAARISASKYWCFTYHVETEKNPVDALSALSALSDSFTESGLGYVMQLEFTQEEGKHFQGYVFSKAVGRVGEFRPFEKFPNLKANHNSMHWEKRKRTHEQAFAYCHKVESRAPGWTPVSSEVIPKDPPPKQVISYERLYPWQKKVADMFVEPAEEFCRKIHVFVERDGAVGKTVLAKYFADTGRALVVNGAGKDMLFAVQKWVETNKGQGPEIVMILQARSQEHVTWGAIESIKDGLFFSGKYEGGMVRFNTPHVLIFGNNDPPFDTMTQDRWINHDMTELLATQ